MTDIKNNKEENCRNCGAPLSKDGKCEYCGTEKIRKSEIVITADLIRFTYN